MSDIELNNTYMPLNLGGVDTLRDAIEDWSGGQSSTTKWVCREGEVRLTSVCIESLAQFQQLLLGQLLLGQLLLLGPVPAGPAGSTHSSLWATVEKKPGHK